MTVPIIAELPGVTIEGVAVDAASAALANALSLDMRAACDFDVLGAITAALAEDRIVVMWDPDRKIRDFSLVMIEGLYLVCEDDGEKSKFATVDAALKYAVRGYAC